MNTFAKNLLNSEFTENNMPTFKSSFNRCLDLFYKVGNQLSTDTLLELFKKAFSENPDLAIKVMGWSRDIRNGGAGRRSNMRNLLESGLISYDKINFSWFVEHGYWRDIFVLDAEKTFPYVEELIKEKFGKDYLLMKWLPRRKKKKEHNHNKWIRRIRKSLGINDKEYRLSFKDFETPEKLISSGRISDIDYKTLPSLCFLKNLDLFYKKDKERVEAYLREVIDGKAKINSKVLFPHEIVQKYYRSGIHTLNIGLEAMWKNLNRSSLSNTIVVADTSGSMYQESAIYISLAMAILFSEVLKGPFKNSFITFSSKPQIVSFNDNDLLKDKLLKIVEIIENTDIKKVFELIYRCGKNAKPEEMPENILIISDMQFDEAVVDGESLNVIELKNKIFGKLPFKYDPNVIFWNVRNSYGIPSEKDERGIILLSGSSQEVIGSLVDIDGNIVTNEKGEKLNPEEAMLKVVDKDEYFWLIRDF